LQLQQPVESIHGYGLLLLPSRVYIVTLAHKLCKTVICDCDCMAALSIGLLGLRGGSKITKNDLNQIEIITEKTDLNQIKTLIFRM